MCVTHTVPSRRPVRIYICRVVRTAMREDMCINVCMETCMNYMDWKSAALTTTLLKCQRYFVSFLDESSALRVKFWSAMSGL